MISITTVSLPYCITGELYNQQLTSDSLETVTWSLSSGSLPTGLSINSSGVISGTPTAVNSNANGTTSTFTITVQNDLGESDSKQLTIVLYSKPNITTAGTTLADFVSGRSRTATLSVTGTRPWTAAIDAGALPTGLSFAFTGTNAITITGAADTAEAGPHTITIKIVNAYGEFSRTYTFNVSNVAPTLSTYTIPLCYYQLPYTVTFPTDGSLPITFSVDSGSLPDGLSLNANTGVLSGTATVKNNFNFTLKVTNDFGTATRVFSINVLTSDVFEGYGTETEPFLIRTATQLAELAVYINAGTVPYANAGIYYKLMNNIDLSEYGETWNNGHGWIPIGNYNNNNINYCFKGIFDGNNKVITKLYINNVNNNLIKVGLFGYIIDIAAVKNLGVEEVIILSSIECLSQAMTQNIYDCGIIAGRNVGTITNCYTSGDISATNTTVSNGWVLVGGIVGNNIGIISDCYSFANVTSIKTNNGQYPYAGGIVGRGDGSLNNKDSVKNCYSTGIVKAINPSSSNDRAGGIYGASNAGYCENCVALNSKIIINNGIYGRILASNINPINCAAFKDMLNPQGTTNWSPKGLNTVNGADITAEEIYADPSMGGRFLEENGWTLEKGKLPGLFGKAVEMPYYLDKVKTVSQVYDKKTGKPIRFVKIKESFFH